MSALPNVGPYPYEQVRRMALKIGGAWLLLCIVGWIFERDAFYRSYLVAWLFWLGVTLGAMGIVMLHHLLGGKWGVMVRRLGEHAAMTLPLLIVLFLPIALGMRSLFIWDRPEALAADAVLRHKHAWLNAPFFLGRAAGYALIWLLMAWYLRAASLRHDRSGDGRIERRMHSVSAIGMAIYFVTMSLAAIDWVMSRDPRWFSTVFGFLVVIGQGLSGICLLIVTFLLLVEHPPFKEFFSADVLNDLGNLLLTLVILWAYLAFVQFLVIWMGNKQDEIPWYVQRLSNGWQWIGLALVVLHFFVPFIVLLMRAAKRRGPIMLGLCAGLLLLRAVDMFWMVAPSGDDPQPRLLHVLSWMDFIFPIGLGGLWVAMFLWLWGDYSLIPEGAANPLRQGNRQGKGH
jgi:hypothetical protein